METLAVYCLISDWMGWMFAFSCKWPLFVSPEGISLAASHSSRVSFAPSASRPSLHQLSRAYPSLGDVSQVEEEFRHYSGS